MRSMVPPTRQGRSRHIADGPSRRGNRALQGLEAAATASRTVAGLAALQRAADASPVLQRHEEDRDALRLYLMEIGDPLKLTEEELEEIVDTAVTAGDLEEGKAWLKDWVDAMISAPAELEKSLDRIGLRGDVEDEMTSRGITEDLFASDQQEDLVERLVTTDKDNRTAVIDKAFEEPTMRVRIRQDLAAANIPETSVQPDELTALLSALKKKQAAETQLRKVDIGKTQKEKQTKARNQAETEYLKLLKSIETRLKDEEEKRRKQKEEQDFRDNFDSDKQILVQWVDNNTGGQVKVILLAVLEAHSIGSGFDATVAKKYPAKDIMAAHNTWWDLYKATKAQLRAFGTFENPGRQDDGIKWKDRGPQWECNRNFIAVIGNHKSNVHVTPNGGAPRSKGQFPIAPAPLK